MQGDERALRNKAEQRRVKTTRCKEGLISANINKKSWKAKICKTLYESAIGAEIYVYETIGKSSRTN